MGRRRNDDVDLDALLDALRAFGKAEERCDLLLQFKSQIILSSFAQKMEMVSDRPEELNAFI